MFYEAFPLKLVNKKYKSKLNIQKDKNLTECKDRLDTLLVLSKKDIKYRDIYNSTKREYNNLLIKAKSQVYESRIRNSDNKSKSMWSICNEISNKKDSPECLIAGNPITIAEEYNNYLIGIIPDLLQNLPQSEFNFDIQANDRSMYLYPITSDEIINLGKSLKNKWTSGEDEIPTNIIKNSIFYLKDILCYIINNSFRYGIFPEQLKLSLIKPLYKKGDVESLTNYRPISLLPGFSKIFELAMCSRAKDFMYSCGLFNTFQHGYIKGRSTQTAIFQFTGRILDLLEDNKRALGMFLDLSKAYDSLNIGFLLTKLERYGIRGNALQLFKSYLSNRRQRVIIQKGINSAKSSILENNLGVPQGSIVGPFLFIVYINDLSNILPNVDRSIINYADDTNMLIGGEDNTDILSKGIKMFEAANKWFLGNKLLLNKEKTNVVVFSTKQNRAEKVTNINLDKLDLSIATNTQFLGICIDEFLDWTDHINKLSLKLNKIAYAIRVISQYMNRNTLKIIYFANFESVIRYGIIFWGGCSVTENLEKIFICQKRVIRLIYNMASKDSCRNVFKINSLLTVYGLYIYECILFLFNNKSIFKKHSQNHNYNTRTLNFDFPVHRLTLTEKGAYYMCIKCFNKLPREIKCIQINRVFKKKVRKLLINLEPYSLSDYLN